MEPKMRHKFDIELDLYKTQNETYNGNIRRPKKVIKKGLKMEL